MGSLWMICVIGYDRVELVDVASRLRPVECGTGQGGAARSGFRH